MKTNIKENPYKPVQLPKKIHAEIKKIAYKKNITIIEVIKKILKNYKEKNISQ